MCQGLILYVSSFFTPFSLLVKVTRASRFFVAALDSLGRRRE
jgi:hypothetical protein